MLLGEPAPTKADLRFQIFGIPVRVHPFFWVFGVLLILRSEPDLKVMLIWLAAMFVSILVHELGHAFMVRYYGGRPWITLLAMGGLCSYQPLRRGSLSNILISAAGPGAGFLLMAFVLAAAHGAGYSVQFFNMFGFIPAPYVHDKIDGSPDLFQLITFLVFVNYFWGLVNLLPVYPLDGGHISRELFMLGNPHNGIKQSLWLSVFTSAGIALFAITQLQAVFMGMMFGYLAYSSWTTLQAYSGRGGGGFGGRGW